MGGGGQLRELKMSGCKGRKTPGVCDLPEAERQSGSRRRRWWVSRVLQRSLDGRVEKPPLGSAMKSDQLVLRQSILGNNGG